MPLAPKAPTEEALPLGGSRQPVIPVRDLYNSRLPVMETTYLAVGGGIGSFTWADHLRNSGDVFQAVDREARRIGWERIFRSGRALAVRKTDDGIAPTASVPEPDVKVLPSSGSSVYDQLRVYVTSYFLAGNTPPGHVNVSCMDDIFDSTLTSTTISQNANIKRKRVLDNCPHS